MTTAGTGLATLLAGLFGGSKLGQRQERRTNAARDTAYVKLTAEDSARLERIAAHLERLIALQEAHQATTERIAQAITDSRLEQATLRGEMMGLLRART